MKYIKCETAEQSFGENQWQCNNGDVSIRWMMSANINTQNRAYQREKVALDSWKQSIMLTILFNTFAGIPEIHIRVIETEGGFRYELIDGQQRITAVLDFLNGEYALPDDFPVVDRCDIAGMKIGEIRDTYPKIYERIKSYRISCKWYEDLSDLQTAHLFINVLNNVNDMKPQEIRNAILGFYSDYVRETARKDGSNLHKLFTREIIVTKTGEKEVLKYFSPSFHLRGRMEVDEWLSELLYLLDNGVTHGITHLNHQLWVEKIQSNGGKYVKKFVDKKSANDFLNFAFAILKATPKKYYKVKLNSMTSLMLVLYADELRNRYGEVNPQKYVPAFFDVYTRWSDTNLGLYKNQMMANGKSQMNPFNELFGGKNPNAIRTIFQVLDKELKDRKDDFGIIELDPKETFNRSDILKKWQEQDGKCYYTGEPIEEDDLAGDHDIPRSWGIARGGVTEYKNLVVTSLYHNNKKGNMTGEDYKKKIT